MKKLLSALLACSLTILLLGFSSCCDTKCKKSAPVGACKAKDKNCASKKQKCVSKKQKGASQEVASLYNPVEESSDFEQFAYLNERIEDFDTSTEAANEMIDGLNPQEQAELNEEINHLVALWKTDEENPVAVDFKTLYLDTDKSGSTIAAPDEVEDRALLAQADDAEEIHKEPALITALDEAADIAKDISIEDDEPSREILSA